MKKTIEETLNKLRNIAENFQNKELKEVSLDLINKIEKCKDTKMQLVMINLWKETIKISTSDKEK